MNDLKAFTNEEFGIIRTVMVNDEPWLVGKDVADALGYSNSRKAIADHVDDEDKGVTKCDTLGGVQELTIINESGLYSLVLSSKLPSARKFKRWVTSEVLPSIRKTGSYGMPKSYPEALRALADKAEEAERLAGEVMQSQKLIAEMKPKADYVDIILQSKSTVVTTQIAKDYGMSARAFNKILHKYGIQYKVNDQWVLYAKYQGMGYTHSGTFNFKRSDGQNDFRMQTEWTQKGRLFLYNTLKAANVLPVIEQR